MAYRTIFEDNLRKIFPPELTSQLDSILLDHILRIYDAKGWSRLREMQFREVSQAGSSTTVIDPIQVPGDKNRVLIFGYLDHSDGAASHAMSWAYQLTIGPGVFTWPFSTWINSSSVQPFALPRPLVVIPPNSAVMGIADPAIPVASVFDLKYLYVDLPLGEYIPFL